MTVWLTPDRKPFYAGTYFPNTQRHGIPSFRQVMESISDAWQNRTDEVIAQADQLTGDVNQKLPAAGDAPGSEVLLSLPIVPFPYLLLVVITTINNSANNFVSTTFTSSGCLLKCSIVPPR